MIGATIELVYVEGEPRYTGKRGVITSIDKDPYSKATRYHGTWGGIAVCPEYGDIIKFVNNEGGENK